MRYFLVLFFVFSCKTTIKKNEEEKQLAAEQNSSKDLREERVQKSKTGQKKSPPKKELPDFPSFGKVLNKSVDLETCNARFAECECSKADNCHPKFKSEVKKIELNLFKKMKGVSYRKGCPMKVDQLRHVRLTHWNEKGEIHWGEVIVAQEVADSIVAVFKELYQIEFPIQQMRLVSEFDGDDNKSMRANNTSAFNCRPIKGTQKWSQHSYGKAIDVNPFWNPWVRGAKVDPPSAKKYADRSLNTKGMIKSGSETVEIFKKNGWIWGGTWKRTKDYQHFSTSGK